jgi:hypothetical protein
MHGAPCCPCSYRTPIIRQLRRKQPVAARPRRIWPGPFHPRLIHRSIPAFVHKPLILLIF